MSGQRHRRQRLDSATLERILEVTRRLASPYDLDAMLECIIDAGRDVLHADRGTVFLFDPSRAELVIRVATGMRELRIPADRGIAGECAQNRRLINVRDCYADPRFSSEVDRETGYRTETLLAVPLIADDETLVGVLQLLNKDSGTFDSRDERVATALAAQCAVALQRVKTTRELLKKERMERELSVARDIQMGFLPRRPPEVEGYDLAGTSLPAEETGGDTFDWIPMTPQRTVILVGDATGHGVGPALSATQVRAMVRIAGRLGAGLEQTLIHVNDQLEQDLASHLMVTAFLGLLDAETHRLTYHAAGQGPLLHFHAASGDFEWRNSTAPPLGCVSPMIWTEPGQFDLEPGDAVAVMTDGIYEHTDGRGEMFGEAGVVDVFRNHPGISSAALTERLLSAVREFGAGSPPGDDITIVLVRRRSDPEL